MNSAFRAGAGEQVYPRLWSRSRRGEPSVTVWDSVSPAICHRGTRFVRLSVGENRAETEIAIGSFRSVTVSPDRRYAALVTAVSALPPPELGKFDREFTYQYLDARVRTILQLADLTTGQICDIGSTGGFRFQSADDAPRWNRSGDHVYAPRFDVGGGEAENFGVVTVAINGCGAGPIVGLQSRRHAELLALSLAHGGASSRGPDDRIASTAKSIQGAKDALGSNVRLFALGSGHVVLCSSAEIRLIDLRSGLAAESLKFKSVSAAWTGGFDHPADTAILEIDRVLHLARVEEATLVLVPIVSPVPGIAPACLLSSGGVMWIERSQAGERLWVCDAKGGAWRDFASLRHPTAHLERFDIRPFHHTSKKGRPLIASMLLPRDHDPSKPSSVVLDVYPFRDYTEDKALAGFDPSNFYDVTPFYFAASGYVVIRPSLPDFEGDVADYHPLEYYVGLLDEIAGALIEAQVAASGRIGIHGVSNGGYLALAVAAGSRTISAVIASSPFPDLLTSGERPALSFSPDDCAPGQFYANQISFVEDPEGPFWRMGTPSYAALDRYLANSPVYRLNANSLPTLIVQGEYDSKGTADSERAYTRLARLGVPVQLARYWGEGHNFSTAGNIRDALAREKAWLDRYLTPKHGAASH